MDNILKNIQWMIYSLESKMRWKYISYSGEYKYAESRHKYAKSVVEFEEIANEKLSQMIVSGKPLMAGRFGLSELFVMRAYECNLKKKIETSVEQLYKWSGFFPGTKEMGKKFADVMKDSCAETDYLAIGYQPMEPYFIKKYMKKNLIMAQFRCFEPWYGKNPWSRVLKGKKVLVIHPFAKTIVTQYGRREQIFPNTDILPEFTLITQEAVQTVAGNKDERFDTWFDALDYMYNEAMKKDFDIALLGCGAYGFPLAAKLKKSGKQAIHMGGMLQILFGIKGQRWDNDPIVAPYYNDIWVRPSDIEKPKNSNVVEGGCYW